MSGIKTTYYLVIKQQLLSIFCLLWTVLVAQADVMSKAQGLEDDTGNRASKSYIESNNISFETVENIGNDASCRPTTVYACGLGLMYLKGINLHQDFLEAARWFKIAAFRGDKIAQYYYSALVPSGEELPKDEESLLEKLTKASKAGEEPTRSVMREVMVYLAVHGGVDEVSQKIIDATEQE